MITIMINNGTWTRWSAIWAEIIRVIERAETKVAKFAIRYSFHFPAIWLVTLNKPWNLIGCFVFSVACSLAGKKMRFKANNGAIREWIAPIRTNQIIGTTSDFKEGVIIKIIILIMIITTVIIRRMILTIIMMIVIIIIIIRSRGRRRILIVIMIIIIIMIMIIIIIIIIIIIMTIIIIIIL